ncbi:hypothetical protein IQ07DRAFT_587123 [Pyrenochaeta sp. DS3sAY3a]|nr:hypothetical protein IQ07DRAFT_587123 [Pyrenochaeta sp. DS3sAY3a]
MDPFRYRKAYEAMVHTTQLIEERLNQEDAASTVEASRDISLDQDYDSMDWTPTEPPPECGPPPALSEKIRHFLPGGGESDYQAVDQGENGVMLHKLKEGMIIDKCIDKLVQDLPEVLSYNNSLSFTPSTIEVPKDFGLQLSISINHHLAQVADRKALEKYRRLLGHRKDAAKRKAIKLGFDPVDLITKQAVAFAEGSGPAISTLENEIHSILRPDNWHGCSDEIYEVLKPGLRLASLLLTSQATAHFWHTLLYGKREPCEQTSEKYGQHCNRIKEDLPWSEDRHATFKSFLNNQVDTVHFFFHHDPLPPETAYASMGLVKDYKNGLMRKINHKCHTSRICLHSDFYTTAKKLSMLTYREPAMVLRFNMFLATCITHEIAHFCEVSGPHHDHPLLSEPEVFFGDNMWTESGIAFETKVFGGRIHPLSSRIDCKFGLACLDYPLKELYDKDDNVLYALPMDYILKLQQKETWEQDFNDKGADIFFVPRTGGRSIEINGTNLMMWEDESDADISDHLDNQDTEWQRMDDGSISKNPKANNRKPQRPPKPRWTPYGQKKKAADEVAASCVSAEVDVDEDSDKVGEESKLEVSEDVDGGKGGSDQDML